MTTYVLEGPGGLPGLKQSPSATTAKLFVFTGGATFSSGTVNFTGATVTGLVVSPAVPLALTGSSANALSVAKSGTNYALNVDTSATSAATGLNLASAAAGSGLALTVISSGTNENMTLAAKGTGTIGLGSPVTVTANSATGFVVGPNGTTNPGLTVATNASSAVTGLSITQTATGTSLKLAVTSSATNESISFNAKGSGVINIGNISTGVVNIGGNVATPGNFLIGTSTVITAGGALNNGLNFSSTANFGIFVGSGVPTISAAQGSLYLRSDGSSTSTRLYVNTTGSTTWTNFTSAA